MYWQVDEADAETVLVAIITTGRDRTVYELPLAAYAAGDWPPEYVYETLGIREGRRTGGRDFGEHDSIAIDDDPGPGVTLRLSRRPSTWLGLVGIGGFRARVTVPVDGASERRLSDDATLTVTFRKPKRPAPPAVQPTRQWEKQLARERTEPSDVSLPPPWPHP